MLKNFLFKKCKLWRNLKNERWKLIDLKYLSLIIIWLKYSVSKIVLFLFFAKLQVNLCISCVSESEILTTSFQKTWFIKLKNLSDEPFIRAHTGSQTRNINWIHAFELSNISTILKFTIFSFLKYFWRFQFKMKRKFSFKSRFGAREHVSEGILF